MGSVGREGAGFLQRGHSDRKENMRWVRGGVVGGDAGLKKERKNRPPHPRNKKKKKEKGKK